MNYILREAREIKDQVISWRRDLHQIPESGLILPKTGAYVKNELDQLKINYETYANHSGIVGMIGKQSGRTIAIRADMDGLIIKEETELPFKSGNDNMHACGHDAHTAILLGAAKILKAHEEKLQGCVKLIFQPGEEGPGGAKPMVEDGVLKNPDVDCILALHIGALDGGDFENGTVLVNHSNMFAADDQVAITIKGKGGHGSQPDVSIDPVAVATLVMNSLQYVVSREIKPGNPAVVTIGSINAGRGAFNIIPDTAELKGTIRCADLETRDFLFKRIREIVSGVSYAMRAEAEVEFLDGYPPLINHQRVVESFVESAKKVIPKDKIVTMKTGVMGGEDAAFFFEKVPGCYFFLRNMMPCPVDGKVYPAHNSKFCLDDSEIYIGSALFAQAAMDFLV